MNNSNNQYCVATLNGSDAQQQHFEMMKQQQQQQQQQFNASMAPHPQAAPHFLAPYGPASNYHYAPSAAAAAAMYHRNQNIQLALQQQQAPPPPPQTTTPMPSPAMACVPLGPPPPMRPAQVIQLQQQQRYGNSGSNANNSMIANKTQHCLSQLMHPMMRQRLNRRHQKFRGRHGGNGQFHGGGDTRRSHINNNNGHRQRSNSSGASSGGQALSLSTSSGANNHQQSSSNKQDPSNNSNHQNNNNSNNNNNKLLKSRRLSNNNQALNNNNNFQKQNNNNLRFQGRKAPSNTTQFIMDDHCLIEPDFDSMRQNIMAHIERGRKRKILEQQQSQLRKKTRDDIIKHASSANDNSSNSNNNSNVSIVPVSDSAATTENTSQSIAPSSINQSIHKDQQKLQQQQQHLDQQTRENLENLGERGTLSMPNSNRGSTRSLNDDDHSSTVSAMYQSPHLEHDYLQEEFQEVYSNIHTERLSSMSKNELINEYLLLEERVEELENQLREAQRINLLEDIDEETNEDLSNSNEIEDSMDALLSAGSRRSKASSPKITSNENQNRKEPEIKIEKGTEKDTSSIETTPSISSSSAPAKTEPINCDDPNNVGSE